MCVVSGCKYCLLKKEDILFETDTSYIVEGSPVFHGHLQVVYKDHVEQITELSPLQFSRFSQDLLRTSAIVKEVFEPDKVNYALLGNWYPHLHWHVYPRYRHEPDFGQPPIIPWKDGDKRVSPARLPVRDQPLSREERGLLMEEFEERFGGVVERDGVPWEHFVLQAESTL